MSIHRDYKRLSYADRAVVDEAFKEVQAAFRSHDRAADNADAAERLVEAIATYLFESGGAARRGSVRRSCSAPAGETHPSYEGATS